MSQLSNEDIRLVEHLANANRELSKNDFIFHIKAKSLNYVNFIIITDPTTRLPICSSSLIALTPSVTIIGMKRYIYIFLLLISLLGIQFRYVVYCKNRNFHFLLTFIIFSQIRKAWKIFDKNGDGRISKQEFRSFYWLSGHIFHLGWTAQYPSKFMT